MIAARLQKWLDEKVAGSPRARDLISQLDGRRMRVVASHTPWELTLLAEGGHLRVLPGEPSGSRGSWPAPDVTLTGTPLALLALQREEPAVVIRRGDVTLSGDGEAGARFQELISLITPDFEEELSRLIGDTPAFGAASLLRKAMDWGRSAVATQATNVGEYLTHERQMLVSRAEGRSFIDGVDALREDVDRLAARVAQLETREPHP
jgi:ubiquinone biosynthesis protein UbiJ